MVAIKKVNPLFECAGRRFHSGSWTRRESILRNEPTVQTLLSSQGIASVAFVPLDSGNLASLWLIRRRGVGGGFGWIASHRRICLEAAI